MPLIKVKHIVSFTSEDPGQPANNLLKAETYRKWRCQEAGEKQASVILELEKATKIHSIDIGNNSSAFVEVLVGRGSWDSTSQYKVLLVTSSFMSPTESKSFTNTSRVRMFGNEKLSKSVAEEKWDRIKVVCTQPFNKNEQYGLSFVSLHSPPDDTNDDARGETSTSSVMTPKRLGSFTLKDEEEDSFAPGSMFFKKKKTTPPPMSAAAEVRAASTAAVSRSCDWTSVGSNFKNRQPVAKPKEERDGAEKPAAVKPVPVKLAKTFTPSKKANEVSTKRKYEDSPRVDNARKGESPKVRANTSPPLKRKKSESSSQPREQVPLNRIMKGVVFVLSGFKNPERAELRDRALEMGAQYKPDWTNGCTHLICAFSNTPKYNQVKGKGKIVSKKWITDCYRKERRLRTSKYHLPGDTSSSEESSDEEEIDTRRRPSPPKPKAVSRDDTPPPDKQNITEPPSSEATESKIVPTKHAEKVNDTDPYSGSTDEEMEEQGKVEKGVGNVVTAPPDSDEDTEDELERLQQQSVPILDDDNDDDNGDDKIYDASTDEENDEGDRDGPESDTPDELPELPDFFSHKHFLLYGEFDQKIRRSLLRYIIAYNGVLEEYMSDNVDFVITTERWDRNFDDALAENASLAFVRPKWIFACDEKCALVPFQPYIIVPA